MSLFVKTYKHLSKIQKGERDYYIEYVEGDMIFRQSFKFKYDRIYFDRYQPDSVPN